MPMKFSQVDGMVKVNIRYTFVVMATNYDAIQKSVFQDYFLLFC